jgi:hypothetical protein
VERVEGLTPVREWRKGYRDIVDFEHTLADDGCVIIKFFLHISKKEQKRRFRKLEKDPLKSWHVQAEDWEHYRKYNEYLVAIEEMLERTDTEWGPWTIVEATDRRWARVKIFETIIRRLEEALSERGLELPEEEAILVPEEDLEELELEQAALAIAEAEEELDDQEQDPGEVAVDEELDGEGPEAAIKTEAAVEAEAEPAATSAAGQE